MNTWCIVKQTPLLDPAEHLGLAEEILHNLDQPDPVIDSVWLEEAERRLAAYRAGKIQAIPAEDVFGKL